MAHFTCEVVYRGIFQKNLAARIAPELRTIFERAGGNLATSGAVAFQFTKQGIITIKADAVEEDRLLELALEAGAEDVRNEVEVFEVITSPTSYLKVKDAIAALGKAVREDAFWGVQAEAAKALGAIHTNPALDELLASVSVAHPKARRAVVRALGEFRDERAAAALEQLIDRGDASYYVEAAATAAMPLLESIGVPSRLASLSGFPGCHRGYVTELADAHLASLDAKSRADVEIFTCGPHGMLVAVAALARRYGVPCQASLEENMACGVGGCAGCTVLVRTPDGPAMKRVCVDGPVFDASTVFSG